MTALRNLSEEQALFAIENGEFGTDVISPDRSVAVIMTQDWCPQWTEMKNWVYSLNNSLDIDIFIFIYNTSPQFNKFLELKERGWKNGVIPYIRYYTDGKLVEESNYLPREEFLIKLKRR